MGPSPEDSLFPIIRPTYFLEKKTIPDKLSDERRMCNQAFIQIFLGARLPRSILFLPERPTDPLSREVSRWETSYFLGMAYMEKTQGT